MRLLSFIFLNTLIVSSGIGACLGPLWCPFGDRRVRLWREVLGFRRHGPGPAGFPIAPALWVVSSLLRNIEYQHSCLTCGELASSKHPARSLHLCLPRSTQTVRTHICCASLSLMLTRWHPLLFIQNEPFQSRWPSYVSVCVCLFCVSPVSSTEIKFFFWLWESVRWAGAGLRLLTEMDATFNVITGWPDSMLEWQTSWASERKLAWWSPQNLKFQFLTQIRPTVHLFMCVAMRKESTRASW